MEFLWSDFSTQSHVNTQAKQTKRLILKGQCASISRSIVLKDGKKLVETYNERAKKKRYIRVFASDFLFGKLPFSSVKSPVTNIGVELYRSRWFVNRKAQPKSAQSSLNHSLETDDGSIAILSKTDNETLKVLAVLAYMTLVVDRVTGSFNIQWKQQPSIVSSVSSSSINRIYADFLIHANFLHNFSSCQRVFVHIWRKKPWKNLKLGKLSKLERQITSNVEVLCLPTFFKLDN